MDLRKAFKRYGNIVESFVHKTRSKKNTDLISRADSDFVPDGVYILHETLGVRGVEGWNKKFNNGVIGILVVEDDHKIVVALEDSPEELQWSEGYELVNRPIEDDKDDKDAESDFNGEDYCKNLNSPEFPAAYYCLNYDKGGRDWHLPSSGELWMIYRHLEEVQTALSIVGGQKFDIDRSDFEKNPWYWSSTEGSAIRAWYLLFDIGKLSFLGSKIMLGTKVRPVSNFQPKSGLKESFTKKIKSTRKSDLISKPSFALDNGVYILHETLGVRTVEGWDKKFNNGVIGILVVEDDHKIVVALEDSPKILHWSKEYKLVNQPIKDKEDAESDFNGEEYCRNLNSPDFPASYYCLNYKKGGCSWYLPSSGELWMIHRHLEEIQNALSIVGGQKFVTEWSCDLRKNPWYWSSTEGSVKGVWGLHLFYNRLGLWDNKANNKSNGNVRPISKFQPSELKESFTKKISSKKNTDLVSKPAFVPDNGVYILHETLGVKTVKGWNKKFNDGVVGILLIEDDHKIVVALEDSPENLYWSKEEKLVNRPADSWKDAESDFNGEEYCRNLNSPEYPAAYYCLNYKKGGRNWYLPSMGELWMICSHIEEIQNALSIVGGKKFVDEYDNRDNNPCYWSSTERDEDCARYLHLYTGNPGRLRKTVDNNVRPISKFQPSELKESFTKKIGKKNVSEIIGKSEEVFDIYLDLKKFVFENSPFKFTDGWYYFDIKNVESIPVCHEFLDDLEINDYNEYLYAYGNILLKKGKSWKDSKLMVEINKSDSSELFDDVVETVPWEYLSDYQGEQERIVDCLLET